MNLSAQFKEYLLAKKDPASKATVKNYLSDLNRFLAWFESKFGRQFTAEQISYETINSFRTELLASHSPASVERNISSLRKFFTFLKLDGKISHSPFEANENCQREKDVDVWKLRDFKNYLYVLNASTLTIKNYIIDVKQFKRWIEETIPPESRNSETELMILNSLNSTIVNDYKNRLLTEMHLSPSSVNRKLSSLRRYMSWANEQGVINSNLEVLNEPKLNPTIIPEAAVLATTEATEAKRSYSRFPPFRLAQKTVAGSRILMDSLLIAPIALLLNSFDHAIWKAQGKPVFEGEKIKTGVGSVLNPISNPTGPVKNVPKSFYAPTYASVAGMPLHKKTWHTLRHRRPNWYIKYHSYPLASYINLALLLVVVILFGYLVTTRLTPESKNSSVLASTASAPPRVLSFQGRITDASGGAISKPTNLRMAIYSSEKASGSALLWEEVDAATPDQDGIFNVLLGKNTPIPSTLFAQNSALWLGVTVETTTELTPRQPIATVAYASNAETLDGLSPITVTSGTKNVVLALNSSGNLTIGGSASPTFQATGGTFTISGKAVALTTTTGSNGNITLAPNGNGVIDLQKVIKNTSNNGTVVQGAVQIDDVLVANGSTTSQAILGVAQSSTGDLIVASSSGITKFRVDNGGSITAGGAFNGLSVNSGTVTSGSWNANQISSTYGGTGINTSASTGVPYISSGIWSIDSNALAANHGGTGWTTYSTGDILFANGSSNLSTLGIGANGNCLISNGSTPTWSSCGSVSSDNIWGESFGAIFPNTLSDDFLIGASTTDSAKFAILNVNQPRGNQTASISGGITLDSGSANIQTTNFNTLTLGGSTTGLIQVEDNAGLSFVTFDTINSFLGIGTETPGYLLDVAGNINSSATISAQDVKTAYPFADVRSFGALGNGSTDDTAAIQNAVNSPGEATLNPSKTYRITNTIVVGDGETLYIPKGSTLLFDSPSSNIAAVEIQGGGKVYGSGTIQSNRSSWDSANPQYGVYLTGSQGTLDIGNVENFEYGAYLMGANQGSAYNNVKIGSLLNSIQGVKLDATGTGWVNQNYIHVDRLTIWSDYETNDPINWANSYGIYIDSHTSNAPNANRFSGSIEGVKTGMRLTGNYNRIDGMRFELNNGTDTIVDIENTSNGDAPSYNWWFGEYANIDWNTQIAGGAKTQRALIGYGIRGLPEYNEDGLVFGPYYRSPKLSYDTPSDEIRLDRDTTRVFTYNASGYFDIPNSNVGIGLSSAPNATLQVAGNASVSGGLTFYGSPVIQSTDNQTLTLGGNTTGNIVLSPTNGSGNIQFTNFTTNGGLLYTNGSGTLAQISAGNLGECLLSNGSGAPSFSACPAASGTNYWGLASGAISPVNSTLDLLIGGTSTASAKFAFTNVQTGTPTLRIYDSASTNYLSLYHDGTNAYVTPSSGELILGAGSGNVVVEDALVNDTTNNSGALRISDKLHVVGTENSVALALFNNAGTGDIFTASSAGTTRFRISNDGKVFLGTGDSSASDNILHVEVTTPSQQGIKVNHTATSGDNYAINGTAIGVGANKNIALYGYATGGTENWGLRVDAGNAYFNDKVGIGTAAPESKVQISGGGLCVGSDANCNSDNNTEGVIYSSSTSMTVYDVAENYPTKDTTLAAGEVVSMDPERGVFVVRSQSAYDPRAIGAISAQPGVLLGGFNGQQYKDDKQVAVALSGRIIVKASNENGPIKQGDFVTASNTPGRVMKSTKPGIVIGQALEDWDQSKDGVMVFIKATYHDPDVYLTDSGDLSLNPTANNDFEVKRNTGETVSRVGAFSDLVVAKLKGGYFELGRLTVNTATIAFASVGDLSTNSLAVATENFTIAGQNIKDYIYSIVDQRIQQKQIAIASPILETDMIKPNGNTLAVKLPSNDKTSKVEIQNASGSAVASIDAAGNVHAEGDLSARSASFSGQVSSDQIQTNDASVGGTLKAGKIIADSLDLSPEALSKLQGSIGSGSGTTNNYYYNDSPAPVASTGTGSANLASIVAGDGTFTNGLISFGQTSFFDASVANRLFVGAQLSIADHSINVLGADLQIQPLGQGGVSFEGGKIAIDTDGNLKVNGNAYFAKNVDISGKLSAGIIAPISGKDLIFQFEDDNSSSNVEFKSGTGSAVLSFNNKGDIKASGSGTFNKLNLSFVPKAIAVSDTEIIASGSAGTAEIKPYQNELTINNPLVTKDSLIYITPKTGLPNQSVYLLRQVPGQSFTVGISKVINKSVPFNWIIIN